MAGWVRLYKELMDKPIWFESTSEQKVILITLLMMANYKEKEWEFKGQKYKAKPGQFVTSLEGIRKNCGNDISIKQIRTALLRFEKYDFLANQSTNRNRLITIVNWDFYQEKDEDRASQKASRGQAEGKQRATTKELKELKNKDIKKSPKVSPSDIDFENAHLIYELRAAKIKPPIDPDFTKWANEFRILRTNFKDHTDDIVKRNIRWSQDGFWATSNIRSASKFRDRYEEIHLDAEKRANGKVLPMFRKPQHDVHGAIERRLAKQQGVVIEIE